MTADEITTKLNALLPGVRGSLRLVAMRDNRFRAYLTLDSGVKITQDIVGGFEEDDIQTLADTVLEEVNFGK